MTDQKSPEINYGGETFERYRLQKESRLTLAEVMAKYDGTFFHGTNGVQAVFDDQGEVHEILSFNLLSPDTPPTSYTEEHHGTFSTWQSDKLPDRIQGSFLSSTRDEGKALMAIIEAAKEEWREWKATEAQHPQVDFRTWKAARVQQEV